jgi:hypothetical protein
MSACECEDGGALRHIIHVVEIKLSGSDCKDIANSDVTPRPSRLLQEQVRGSTLITMSLTVNANGCSALQHWSSILMEEQKQKSLEEHPTSTHHLKMSNLDTLQGARSVIITYAAVAAVVTCRPCRRLSSASGVTTSALPPDCPRHHFCGHGLLDVQHSYWRPNRPEHGLA